MFLHCIQHLSHENMKPKMCEQWTNFSQAWLKYKDDPEVSKYFMKMMRLWASWPCFIVYSIASCSFVIVKVWECVENVSVPYRYMRLCIKEVAYSAACLYTHISVHTHTVFLYAYGLHIHTFIPFLYLCVLSAQYACTYSYHMYGTCVHKCDERQKNALRCIYCACICSVRTPIKQPFMQRHRRQLLMWLLISLGLFS